MNKLWGALGVTVLALQGALDEEGWTFLEMVALVTVPVAVDVWGKILVARIESVTTLLGGTVEHDE